MLKQIKPEAINVIESATLAVASSYTIHADEQNRPTSFVISICIDSQKAGIKDVEIPLFLPPDVAYLSSGHISMLTAFENGEAFCAIECENLRVFYDDEKNSYFAKADSFSVPENFDKWEDIIL